jgi:hypothetical protein
VTTWDELVSTALVGTERRQLPGGADGWSRPAGDPEATLLDRAAIEVARRRAGRTAGRAEPLPPARDEHLPRVGRAAAQRLARMLGGDHATLLPEWLDAVAARGLRAPEHLLPDLLQRGRSERSARPAIAAVAGARGTWLARLNPEWAYLLAEAGDQPLDRGVWELGGSAERRGWLASLRARDPDTARQALAATWPSEALPDRLAFLWSLQEGLSPADEPFLEAALDDRRREVRLAAADLLGRLPGSALSRRMARRALACLRRQRLPRDELVVEPLTECDREMERDGVQRRPPGGTGERAWWLIQLVARAPLDTWIGWLGETPAEVVGLACHDWGPVVQEGWVRAAIAQRDPRWAAALAEGGASVGLLAVLPPAERARLATPRIRAVPRLEPQVAELLHGLPGPWTGELAEAVLDKIATAKPDNPFLESLCHNAAERLAPGLYRRVPALRPEPHRAVIRLGATLRFRHDMLKELQ